LVIFKTNLVRDWKIAKFQGKRKKIIGKENISTKNPKKFKVDVGSIGNCTKFWIFGLTEFVFLTPPKFLVIYSKSTIKAL
jgi:hypothetical protein